jgi:uncharacterized protein (TIGR03437 family)
MGSRPLMLITKRHRSGLLLLRFGEFVLLSLFTSSVLFAQTLQVLPSQALIRMVAAGPLAIPQTLSIRSDATASLSWKATVSDDAPWISMSAVAGTTPAQISLSLVDWRGAAQPPGNYSGKITFSAAGTTSTVVNVIWTVVPKGPDPTFSYPSGVNGCTPTAGYPDPAMCQVPDEKPPGNFQPPAPGGSYADPNFGASVKVVTGSGVYHTYSANNPLSAKSKYLMTYLTNGTFNVVEVATAQVAFTRVSANQDFFWDSYVDPVYYYPNGAAFIKHDLQSGLESTVIDYAKDGHKFTLIKRGGTTGSSKDNWISFFAPNEKQVCVLDLNTVKTYCEDYGSVPGQPYGTIDYTLDSKGVDKASGKRYVILVAGNSGFYSVNLKTGKLDLEFRGPEAPDSNGNHDGICDPGEKCMNTSHSDTLEDSSGTQYIVFDSFTENPCEVATATYQLNKGVSILQPVELGGGRRKVMSLWQCPFPNTNGGTDEHVGCAKNAPFCVISTVAPYRSASDPPLRFPHATEIIVMRENGLESRRLAESRSVRFLEEGTEAYWAEPRAAISNDGSLVVSDSNFGAIGGVRVTLIATGFGKPPAMAVLNAASLWPSLAPGAYASLMGSGLANCTAQPDSSSLPDHLCGTRVSVNGLPAKLTYASPRQTNFLLPRSLPAHTDLTVTASVEGTSEPFVSVVPATQFAEVAPAIFAYALEDGVSRAVVQNAAGSLNGPAASGSGTTPAVLGEVQILWANGLGPTNQTVPDGEPAPSAPSLAETWRSVGIYVNGTRQSVLFSGMAPGLSGVYQVNFLLSPDTLMTNEDRNFVWIDVDGVVSPQLPISLSAAAK